MSAHPIKTEATCSPGRWDGLTSAPRLFLTIALAAAAVLLYEIGVTRILSVIVWYHFAFLAVSLALLGLGVPGVWFALRGVRGRALEWALIASAVTVPLSVIALLQLGGSLPVRAAMATVCILIPMLALGSVVCILLLEAKGRRIGRMYGADLVGATVGALVVVPLMNLLPTPGIVAGAGLLPALGLILAGRSRVGVVLLVAITALVAWNEPLRVHYTKVYSEKDLHILYEKWTPTARLTVFQRPEDLQALGWGFGTNFVQRPVEQLWLEQDGHAGTAITRLTGSPETLDHLLYDVTSVGYQIRKAHRVCVIGAGGGRDVLTALATGADDVDAVELNPHIVKLVSNEFGDFSGDVYHLPGVHAVVSEGRSFLASSPGQYDMIQISLIDSWAATAAGAFSLSENYLYTLEAYRMYWNRLSENGMVSTTRWINVLEAIRLAYLVREALKREDVEDPGQHLAIVGGGRMATVLASRQPFTGALYDSLRAVCATRGFYLHWPVPPEHAGIPGILPLLDEGPTAFADKGIDLAVPVDNRPFFFHDVHVFGRIDRAAAARYTNPEPVLVLRLLMLLVSAAAIVLFFLPFVLRGALPRGPGFWRGSFYFLLIGLAFMLVELPMVQRLILYLGHPSHAATVGLASILLGAGLGSLASGSVVRRSIGGRVLVIPIIIAVSSLIFGAISHETIGWSWIVRAGIAALLVGGMGVVMGFGLPMGMMRFGDEAKAWFWAMNGVGGVVAGVFSLGLAMTFGFAMVVWMGTALYVAAMGLLMGQLAVDSG